MRLNGSSSLSLHCSCMAAPTDHSLRSWSCGSWLAIAAASASARDGSVPRTAQMRCTRAAVPTASIVCIPRSGCAAHSTAGQPEASCLALLELVAADDEATGLDSNNDSEAPSIPWALQCISALHYACLRDRCIDDALDHTCQLANTSDDAALTASRQCKPVLANQRIERSQRAQSNPRSAPASTLGVPLNSRVCH
jgi:hypothetical protein